MLRTGIRNKILLVLGFLLLVAVSLYTVLASSMFREEKVALLYEINHSIAINAAAQLKSAIVQIGEQVKPYVLTRLFSKSRQFRIDPRALKESRVISLDVYQITKKGARPVTVDSDFPNTELELSNIENHVEETVKSGYSFWKNNLSHRLFLATKLEIKRRKKSSTYIVVSELQSDFFFQPLQMANLFKSFLINKKGQVLLYVDESRILPAPLLKSHPLVEKISSSDTAIASGVQSYHFERETWYGAFTPVGVGNLFLISQASHQHVKRALTDLAKRSMRFAIIVLIATFLASILFSQGLTKNLQALAEGARQIGRGDLRTKVKLKSGDEVEELAESLNWMVSELRTSRDKIERHNRELEEKVNERTKELREKTIAIKEAQEALLKTTQLAAAGEIAGRTAHEILNPLTGIITRSEKSSRTVNAANSDNYARQMLAILNAWKQDFNDGGMAKLTKNLSAPSQIDPNISLLEEDIQNLEKLAELWETQHSGFAEEFKFIYERGLRINHIVNQMRKLIRSSSVKEQINCSEAIREAVSTMSDYIEKQGISLEFSLKAEQDTALLNSEEFTQIVTNLIRNAVQSIAAAPSDWKKEGKITLSTENREETLFVFITDNGPGISPEIQEKLFSQGFTTKSTEEGTGLGLAICRRYARAFGGEVDLLFSEPQSRGTCFQLTIPLATAEKKLAA